MFDVFVFLLEHFQNLGHFPSKHYISEKLNEAGFEYEEIASVLKCFDDIFNENNQYNKQDVSGHHPKMRIFSREEIQAIPSDIRGYIHFLYQEKAMNFYEIEMIIHAIMEMDKEHLELETVKVITLIIAWINQSEIPILVGDDLLSALYEKKLVH